MSFDVSKISLLLFLSIQRSNGVSISILLNHSSLFLSMVFCVLFYRISFQKLLFFASRSFMVHASTCCCSWKNGAAQSSNFCILTLSFPDTSHLVYLCCCNSFDIRLTSGVVFPFAAILVPRYSKLLTLSITFPSIPITASLSYLSMSTTLNFLYIQT